MDLLFGLPPWTDHDYLQRLTKDSWECCNLPCGWHWGRASSSKPWRPARPAKRSFNHSERPLYRLNAAEKGQSEGQRGARGAAARACGRLSPCSGLSITAAEKFQIADQPAAAVRSTAVAAACFSGAAGGLRWAGAQGCAGRLCRLPQQAGRCLSGGAGAAGGERHWRQRSLHGADQGALAKPPLPSLSGLLWAHLLSELVSRGFAAACAYAS